MNNEKFSWVDTHKEITKYLSTKEDSQLELIQLLKEVGISLFNDKSDTVGIDDSELDEIDPFTFFCYIYKYGSKKRLEYLQKIAELLNITIPKGESGIPSAKGQKVWLFPYKIKRKNNEVKRLWSFFHKAISNNITENDFQDVLKIENVGITKLTEALFYVRPERYLPINGPTRHYIQEVIGLKPNFETYSEYIELLENIKKKSDLPFYELSYEAWKWNKQNNGINYWIFQGNPKVFDFERALKENILTDWTVSAHKEKIKVGDKVILWITGNKSGCFALAEVTSEPQEKTVSPDDHLWKTEDRNKLKANISITHNLVDNPILKDELFGIKELSKLKVGNQGTNFIATQEEFEKILELAENRHTKKYWLYAPGENAYMWDEFYGLNIMGLGWDEIGDLNELGNLEDITQTIQKKYNTESKSYNDALANFEFRDIIKEGDIIIAKKGRKEYLGYGIVTSGYYYDNTREKYRKCRKVDWKKKGKWNEVDHPIVIKTLTDISKYPDYVKRLINLIGIENTIMDKTTDYPLNTIFYGPPGTGKTYNTVLRAAEIIENRKIDSYDEALNIFKSKLHDQIEFITFHQNYSYEDFIQGIRPDTENEGDLSFEKKDGIFKVIADRALKNILASKNSANYHRDFDEVFTEFIKPLNSEQEEIEVKMLKSSFYITEVTNKSIKFRKKGGDSNNTLSISTLRQMYNKEKNNLIFWGLQPYYNPLLNKLFESGKLDDNSIKQKNYVIIIDEINRANISRVFGELITLIESDKRSHGTIPMEAKLPSGDIFIVPSNLYIIGTMNTADKSIALLDIALRRRFEFEPMYPLYEIESHEIYDVDILKKLNEQIKKSKGYDFQIGHAYFMGKNYNLVQQMNKKVIPLLLEYYMNDEREVKGILQLAGLKVEDNTWPIRITGKK